MMSAGKSLLDDADSTMPALSYAVALQTLASKVGFDWSDPRGVLDKIQEEAEELLSEINAAAPDKIQAELGDLLFAITNLARHLNVDPQQALQQTNQKFYRRFSFIEQQLTHQGKSVENASLLEMDALWERSKTEQSV
ncbi:Nucleoside triphosphate pyrophosphohydrolase MazG [Methylophaga frappieri]|uniref:Nucleoside triphosphate pyrophosphohydrolase MazG n=1 Tax=Methylophaga frappieri (strain ATCC BAA-2434 / DSM 25690 / JAM7) TaxID=754477 RepID=I1YE99_METFJ|nr:MazG nucleotide pyrophosphohydrolase domain-containing protein [Methylophaga frappieri]AFJ01242.1 Nucleoside triphosphate pyrophosphohydrolase MazG [Methylophaga frappieri]